MRNIYEQDCSCQSTATMPLMPLHPVFAHAYVPFQQNTGNIYSLEKGLRCGTVFEDLDFPYRTGC